MGLRRPATVSAKAQIVMTQKWSQIVWAHWPVDPSQVAALLPPGLAPETYGGCAWVGLVPFQMSYLQLRGALSGLSSLVGVTSFGEVNVRTYVKGPNGRTGVWFATLDADRALAVVTARIDFGLPYRLAVTRLAVTADGEHEQLNWTSMRRHDRARATLQVTPEDVPPRLAAPGLERFLVERYSLYSSWHGRLLEGTLSHPPWRVRSARLTEVDSGTITAAGFRVAGAPHVLVGEPVEVRVHPFRQLRSSASDDVGRAGDPKAGVGRP